MMTNRTLMGLLVTSMVISACGITRLAQEDVTGSGQ